MKVKAIHSEWIYSDNIRRMDCMPFLSGAIEVRDILKKSSLQKESLHQLTTGHEGGIYNGPHFRRIYISSPEHSVPFLTSSSILESDLSSQPRLRKKDALSRKLSFLEIKHGMTLISCSGTIGKTAYARQNMDGMWSSQDVLKIVPNPKKIHSGYLFAYLKSSYGVPMLMSGTYGTIIQHLEPDHLLDMPVVRLEKDAELTIHNLIEEAARLRTNGSNNLQDATDLFLRTAGLIEINSNISKNSFKNIGSSIALTQTSLRSWNYLPAILEIDRNVRKLCKKIIHLGDLVITDTLKSGPRFKRIDAEGEHAVPLIGQREIFIIEPEGRLISRNHIPKNFLIFVPDSTIMIAAQGGIRWHDSFGRAQFISGRWCNFAYSQHFIRVIADKAKIPPAVLFAYIRSNIGFALLRGCAIGTMQQDFHPELLSRIPVPIIDEKEMKKIDQLVRDAYAKFDEAYEKEQTAIRMVEQAIQEAA